MTDLASMALLDDAIEASGGLARWDRLKRFTLHLSIEGMLFSRIGRAGQFKDLTAEGSTHGRIASGLLLRLLDLELFDNAVSSRAPGRGGGRTAAVSRERAAVAA